jgi:hypothetical protein
MNNATDAKARIEPDLVRRSCGGWLAIAPLNTPIRIAVTAQTPEKAVEKFLFTFKRWVEILEGVGT